jgi:hypothetical protein
MDSGSRLARVRSQSAAAAAVVRTAYQHALAAVQEELIAAEYARWQAAKQAEITGLELDRAKALLSLGEAHKHAAAHIQSSVATASKQVAAWKDVSNLTVERYQEAKFENDAAAAEAWRTDPVRRYDSTRKKFLEETRVRSAVRPSWHQSSRRQPEGRVPASVPEAVDDFSAIRAAEAAARETAARIAAAKLKRHEERAVAKQRGASALQANVNRKDADDVLDQLGRLQIRDRCHFVVIVSQKLLAPSPCLMDVAC